jgi:hypothetical protein
MAKDARLDLGRYISNPFNRRGHIPKRLDFNDLFVSKSKDGEYPWNPSRFSENDLLKRAQTRKQTLNPDLNFIGNSPFFDAGDEVNPQERYEMFEGLGRFDRPFDYDFDEGRARTEGRPQSQPDFNGEWVEAYKMSPTLNPGKMSKNPMPRTRNPDPNGYLMAMAEQRAESEAEGKPDISDLLKRKGQIQSEQKESRTEKEGQETVDKVENSPDKIKGTE